MCPGVKCTMSKKEHYIRSPNYTCITCYNVTRPNNVKSFIKYVLPDDLSSLSQQQFLEHSQSMTLLEDFRRETKDSNVCIN